MKKRDVKETLISTAFGAVVLVVLVSISYGFVIAFRDYPLVSAIIIGVIGFILSSYFIGYIIRDI
jgi:uncharacterized membrane protein YvlD (DUF360 family)